MRPGIVQVEGATFFIIVVTREGGCGQSGIPVPFEVKIRYGNDTRF